ncbi:MAG: uracil-DNA glycosylase, partial [Pseudomonadales bacterium]|nr:uracil-DNA glycosylase [Pseudomonadales bacterium]
MANASVQLEASWQNLLGEQFEQPYMQQLSSFLRAEKARGAQIFPPGKQMFAALNLTPVDKVKVVIIGQDPYHGPNQAHGLCFSVLPGTPLPPSLRDILKEIQSDLGVQQEIRPDRGCLTSWAQ